MLTQNVEKAHYTASNDISRALVSLELVMRKVFGINAKVELR
jgi:hypothetical protein